MKKGVRRFISYSAIGIGTFAFDLALLSFLTEILGWDPVLSAGAAFLMAVTINYALSRKLVFKGTDRSVHHGYAIFLVITGIGLVAVTGLMAFFTSVLDWHYAPSRVLIAAVVGIWNYLMNLYVTFRVAGRH